ncbi:MAG: hypothetical protein ACRYGA_10020 [Janthinobacterium lividum]
MPRHKIISARVRSCELAPDHHRTCNAATQSTGTEIETMHAVADEPLTVSHGESA